MLLSDALLAQAKNQQSIHRPLIHRRPILIDPIGARNAEQILDDVGRIISWLTMQCAFAHHDELFGKTIAYVGLNSRWHIDLLLACEQLGAMFMPINYRLAAPEIHAQLTDAQSVLLICDEGMANLAQQVHKCAAHHSYSVTLNTADLTAYPYQAATQRHSDNPCLLVYTSGSTGQAKGVLHSPKTLMANAIAAWDAHDMTANDRILSALPLFHVGGLCIQTLPALLLGAQVRLLARFDPAGWLSAVAADQITLSLLVPPVMKALLEHSDFETTNLSSLRLLMAGSSIVPKNLIDAFHHRGLLLGQVYGATETGPVSIVLKADQALHKVGFAGWPAKDVSVTLLNETNAIGEIALRAPNLMLGYLHELLRDRNMWFATGDLATRSSDGCYRVVGRSNELIISGGENIHPAEIENQLLTIAGIAEVAVIGQPDERWGEVAVACLVADVGMEPMADEILRNILEAHIARFKIPRAFVWMNSLPKSALGKVQKADLKIQVAKKQAIK